jgi:hypothetical protein
MTSTLRRMPSQKGQTAGVSGSYVLRLLPVKQALEINVVWDRITVHEGETLGQK